MSSKRKHGSCRFSWLSSEPGCRKSRMSSQPSSSGWLSLPPQSQSDTFFKSSGLSLHLPCGRDLAQLHFDVALPGGLCSTMTMSLCYMSSRASTISEATLEAAGNCHQSTRANQHADFVCKFASLVPQTFNLHAPSASSSHRLCLVDQLGSKGHFQGKQAMEDLPSASASDEIEELPSDNEVSPTDCVALEELPCTTLCCQRHCFQRIRDEHGPRLDEIQVALRECRNNEQKKMIQPFDKTSFHAQGVAWLQCCLCCMAA